MNNTLNKIIILILSRKSKSTCSLFNNWSLLLRSHGRFIFNNLLYTYLRSFYKSIFYIFIMNFHLINIIQLLNMEVDKLWENYSKLKKQRNQIIKQTQLKLQEMQKISNNHRTQLNSIHFDDHLPVKLMQILQNSIVNNLPKKGQKIDVHYGDIEQSVNKSKRSRKYMEVAVRDRQQSERQPNIQQFFRQNKSKNSVEESEKAVKSYRNIQKFNYKDLYRQKYETGSKSSINIQQHKPSQTPPTQTPKPQKQRPINITNY